MTNSAPSTLSPAKSGELNKELIDSLDDDLKCIFDGRLSMGELQDRLVKYGEENWMSFTAVKEVFKGRFMLAQSKMTVLPDQVNGATDELRRFLGMKV